MLSNVNATVKSMMDVWELGVEKNERHYNQEVSCKMFNKIPECLFHGHLNNLHGTTVQKTYSLSGKTLEINIFPMFFQN